MQLQAFFLPAVVHMGSHAVTLVLVAAIRAIHLSTLRVSVVHMGSHVVTIVAVAAIHAIYLSTLFVLPVPPT